MFFHVNTRKGCVVLTNSSVKHSFNMALPVSCSTFARLLLDLIKIFKMAAELYNCVLGQVDWGKLTNWPHILAHR